VEDEAFTVPFQLGNKGANVTEFPVIKSCGNGGKTDLTSPFAEG
jgi:hypothetical protein